MSSIATAPEGAAPGESRATHPNRVRTLGANLDVAVGLGLAAALCAIVFLTTGGTDTGGTDLGPNTWVQIVLVLIGAGAAVLVLVKGARGPAWGGITLLLFGALAAFTALSIAWSVQPDNSWLEANRTLSYLAAFGGAIALARLYPERWPGVVGGVALATSLVCAYALLVKVFPATFDPQETLGRLKAPLDYWNATGLVGALGLPACLWAGSRREGVSVLHGLAVPATALCATVVVLSYSRSALLAAILAAALWFVLVPVRLRGALVLALGLAGAGVLTGWALLTHAFTHDYVPLAQRTAAGHPFGIVLLLTLILFTIAGIAAASAMNRFELPAATRRRLGRSLVALVVVVPLCVGIGALVTSSRGATGEISHVWSTLTSETATVGDNPGRLGELASSRARDWHEGIKVGEHALLKGVGALGFATARGRYMKDKYFVQHAHSYVIETFADFGLIGIALNLALLIAWGLASARTVGGRTAVVPPERAAERAGLLTLLCVVVAFGVHSSIDWTWFIPGTAIPALICAGWLAGRGPLTAPVGRRAARRRLSQRPGIAAAVAGIAAAALLCAWVVWQPLRSAQADSAAITEAASGNLGAAVTDARAAAARDPLALQPLWELSSIDIALREPVTARAELVNAVNLQPENSDSWLALGNYDLYQQHQPALALVALGRALSLNINSAPAQTAITAAREELAAGHTAPAK